uniref:Uncharacterized protein n=1 Tax=Tanacetum cinerariifolium TaxID=118510 RepID=A0A699GWN4_TANCI|nr:hypothetical protein [Tanacetum cinerariifolium]
MPPKPDLVFHDAPNVTETNHPAFNVKLSPTKPDTNLSHTHRPSAPIIKDWVSDSEENYKVEIPHYTPSFVQTTEQVKLPRSSIKTVKTSISAANPKTAIPKPKSNGNRRIRKACFVCKSLTHLIQDCDYYDKKIAQTTARTHAQKGNNQQYARMTLPNPHQHVVPTTVLTKSKLVPITAARPVTVAVPKPHVTRPRQAKTVVTKPHSPPRRTINRSPSLKSSTFPPKATAAKAPMGNPQHALKEKGVIDSGCSRHMIMNMSYLSDFEERNGGYVAFGGNTKGGKISGKDDNQVLLRVPRENNMYNVNLKNIVPSGDLTCFFTKETLDESNLWHRRLGHINFKTINELVKGNLVRGLPAKVFENDHTCVACKKGKQHRAFCSGPTWLFDIDTLTKTMNYQPVTAGNQSNPSAGVQEQFDVEKAKEESAQQYVLFPVWSSGSTNPQKTDDDATIGGKKPEFEGRKPESKVHVSPSSSAQTNKHDDKTKREAKGKSHVDFAVGQISTNSTNTFSVAGPSNIAKVWVLVDLPHGKRAIVTKWVFRNKKDERGIIVRNEARLVAQGHTQEEGINYEEVFSPVVRIEAIRLFLAYVSFMGFMVYQMDVKSAFLYGTIEEEVYVYQPPGFEDPDYPVKVYKVVMALYGLHQALKAWYKTITNYLLENGFQRGNIDQTLFIKRQKGIQVKQKPDGIFISQDRYVAEILRKFGLTNRKSASTPIDTEKPLLKYTNGEDVDMHTYRSMIGSLMYLTSSRPDIMFAVYACARFQVTPKASHLHVVKKIFRYLKGKPYLGLWYPKDSPFNLVAYSDSDYAGASLHKKSTTGDVNSLDAD